MGYEASGSDGKLACPGSKASSTGPRRLDPRSLDLRSPKSQGKGSRERGFDPGHPESAPPAARIRSPSTQASIAGHPGLQPRIARPGDRPIVAISIAFHDLAVAGASLCGSARERGGPASQAIQDPSSHLPVARSKLRSPGIEASYLRHASLQVWIRTQVHHVWVNSGHVARVVDADSSLACARGAR